MVLKTICGFSGEKVGCDFEFLSHNSMYDTFYSVDVEGANGFK